MELCKGTTLQCGKYTIEKSLGQGSFGITYLATARFSADGGIGKMDVVAKVAIKEFFMSEVNTRKEDGSTIEGSTGSVFNNYRRKFRKEAENLARLFHLNIVKVFDVFDENDTTYYVMEYIDGENLDDYIKSCGRLPEEEAIKIIKEIGGALSYMHSKKMLHLDMKPKNVMHRIDSSNCLIDFGLSKKYTEDGEPESSTTIGLGTPGYAPLEQSQYTQDGSFPATLDVYALGATLFKMLTGKRPPEASILLNEGFPTDELNRLGISKRTVRALSKAMNPVKKDRWMTVDLFLKGLSFPGNLEKNRLQGADDEETTIKKDDNIPFYNRKSFGLIVAVLGCFLIVVMRSFVHTGRFDFSDLDSDGKLLAFLYGLGSVCLSLYFIRKKYKRQRIDPNQKYIFLILFVINTLLLQMWNHSLTAAYLVLSIGLLWNVIVLYFYSNNYEQDKISLP